MRDLKPAARLFLVQALLLGLLALWWLSLPAAERSARLASLQEHEAVGTAAPPGLTAQIDWLWTHRLRQLTGMVGLLVVAGLMGVGEGALRRQRDVFGGFRLRWWTGAQTARALMPGVLVGYLLAPWPLPVLGGACGLAGAIGLIGYGLARGCPLLSHER
jgi:hypothetical protein